MTRKWFQPGHSKTCKKLKKVHFKRWQYSCLSSRYPQDHFLRSLLSPSFDLNRFGRFASLSQKMVSTSPLKTLEKSEKRPFQTLTTGFFELNVASKPFSKKFPLIKLWFKQFKTLRLTFPENSFNFVTQNVAKNWKIVFSNAKKLRFWAQGSYKIIFWEVCDDQILI